MISKKILKLNLTNFLESYFLPQSQFLNKETGDQRLKRNKSESEAESVKATENKRKSAGSVQSLPLIDANQLHKHVPINDHIAHSTPGSAKVCFFKFASNALVKISFHISEPTDFATENDKQRHDIRC